MEIKRGKKFQSVISSIYSLVIRSIWEKRDYVADSFRCSTKKKRTYQNHVVVERNISKISNVNSVTKIPCAAPIGVLKYIDMVFGIRNIKKHNSRKNNNIQSTLTISNSATSL